MSIKKDLEYITLLFKEIDLKEIYKEDKIKAKEIFNNTIDVLCKDREISERTYENVFLIMNKRNQLVMECLSYRMLLE